MENRRLTVFNVLQDGLKKTFNHFLVCLKGLFGIMLICFAAFVGLTLMNLSLILKFVHQAPELMEQFKACGESIACQKAVFWPLISPHLIVLIISICLAVLIFSWLAFGMIRYFLHVHDTGTASIKDLFLPFGKAMRIAAAAWLYLFIVIGGLVLLIIPGIYWGIRFSQFSYFIIDKNAGIIESLKMSWAATDGYTWQLFFLMFVGNIIGAIGGSFMLLMLITIPVSSLMNACIYRKLTNTHGKSEETVTEA